VDRRRLCLRLVAAIVLSYRPSVGDSNMPEGQLMTKYRSVRFGVGVKCGVRGSFVGRSFPHHRSGPDGEQPGYTHAHARGDGPTQRLHPRCPSVGRHWGLRGVAQSFPSCLKHSMGEQPGQSASTVACCPPTEFLILHHGGDSMCSLFKWELIYPRIPGPLRYRMAQPFVTGA